MAKTRPADQRPDPADMAAFPFMTNIDRRKCKRVVPMRVLALGVSRSGTASLRQALLDLGYKDCYHYSALLQENPRDQDMWIEAYEAKYENKGKPFTRRDWDQLLGHCQAVTDSPCAIFYKELLEAYPEAKVILTVRDSADQWFKSQMATLVPYFETYCRLDVDLATRVYRWFLPLDDRSYRMNNLQFNNAPMFKCLMNDYRNGGETAKQWYLDHIEEIKAIVPKEKLLVMNVKEGWEPLCKFLGEEVPQYSFPRKNDTMMFKKNVSGFSAFLDQVAKWNMIKTAGAVLGLSIAAAVGAHRYGILQGVRILK